MVIAMKNDQQTSAPVCECNSLRPFMLRVSFIFRRCPSIVVHEEVNGIDWVYLSIVENGRIFENRF